MSASSRADSDTTAILDASGWAPPTPSTCIGWPLPITATSSASRCCGSAGRSAARKYRPFEVPPRISRHRTPSPVTGVPPGTGTRRSRGRFLVAVVVHVLDTEAGQHGAQPVPVQAQLPAAERGPGRALLVGARPGRGHGGADRRPRYHHDPVVVGEDRVARHDLLAADADRDVDRAGRGLDRA